MNWIKYRIKRGYISNIPPDGGSEEPDYMAPGTSNFLVIGPQLVEAFKGMPTTTNNASTLNWAFGDSLLGLGLNHGSGIGSGSAVLFVGRAIFFIGAGGLKYNGSQIGPLVASTALRLTLWNGSSYGTTAYQAGLDKPSAPTLSLTGAGAKVSGTRSVVFTKVRTTTGAESNGSLPSNIVVAVNQQLISTFPTFGTWMDSTDAYNVYVTPENFGKTGPWLFYKQINASSPGFNSGTGDYTFDFLDAELTPDTPPVNFNVAPAGTHAFSMGNIFNVVGAFSGVGLSSSVPNFPESFPPTSTFFLPEIIVGTLGSPQDGFTFLICKGSTHAAVWTGAPNGPSIIARSLWKNIGFANINNVAIAGTDLYGFTEKGIVRTGPNGEPDFQFSRRIWSDIAAWVASDVVVGYSPLDNTVVFGHSQTMIAYHIDLDQWSSPLSPASAGSDPVVAFEVVSNMYTKSNILNIATRDTTNNTYRTRLWNSGTGSTSSFFHTPNFVAGMSDYDYKNIERVVINGKYDTASVFVYRDYGGNVANISTPSSSIADKISKWLKFNVRNTKSFKVSINLTIGFSRLYGIDIGYEVDPILQG